MLRKCEMIYNEEIQNQIQEEDDGLSFLPPQRKASPPVSHTTRVGEIVYQYLGKRHCPLLFIKANDFVSESLIAGMAYWYIEAKLVSIMAWAKERRVHPLGVVKTLNKAIKSIHV